MHSDQDSRMISLQLINKKYIVLIEDPNSNTIPRIYKRVLVSIYPKRFTTFNTVKVPMVAGGSSISLSTKNSPVCGGFKVAYVTFR